VGRVEGLGPAAVAESAAPADRWERVANTLAERVAMRRPARFGVQSKERKPVPPLLSVGSLVAASRGSPARAREPQHRLRCPSPRRSATLSCQGFLPCELLTRGRRRNRLNQSRPSATVRHAGYERWGVGGEAA
jgi:hypothetical protein